MPRHLSSKRGRGKHWEPDLCFGQLREQVYIIQVWRKSNTRRVNKRDLRKPERAFRQDQAPKVC